MGLLGMFNLQTIAPILLVLTKRCICLPCLWLLDTIRCAVMFLCIPGNCGSDCYSILSSNPKRDGRESSLGLCGLASSWNTRRKPSHQPSLSGTQPTFLDSALLLRGQRKWSKSICGYEPSPDPGPSCVCWMRPSWILVCIFSTSGLSPVNPQPMSSRR